VLSVLAQACLPAAAPRASLREELQSVVDGTLSEQGAVLAKDVRGKLSRMIGRAATRIEHDGSKQETVEASQMFFHSFSMEMVLNARQARPGAQGETEVRSEDYKAAHGKLCPVHPFC
jgi:hypothetical protein